MDYTSDFIREKEKLQLVLKIIQRMIQQQEQKYIESENRVKTLYETFSEDTPEFYSEIPVAESIYHMNRKDLEDMRKAFFNPYFGKLVFSFNWNPGIQTKYLGKKGISDDELPDGDIIDWRTPLADVYYSGKMGQTSYIAPQGQIDLDLKQKSTIKIRNGELQSLYDSEVVVSDDLLSEYLSKNKGTVLNEIIATIQDDQNRIIRKPIYANLIVQGVAGSGKTTVALHRISYLLYNFKDTLSYENVLLIAANELFLGYITAMLPDLDVPQIKQGIMENIFMDAIEDYARRFKRPGQISTAYNPIYENEHFIEKFEAEVAAIERRVFGDQGVKLMRFRVLTKQEVDYYNSKNQNSILAKATQLDEFIEKKIKDSKDIIIDYIIDNKKDETVREFACDHFQLQPDQLFEFNLNKNFGKLVSRYRRYFYKRADQVDCEQAFLDFAGKTDKSMSLNDLACQLLFYIRIRGNQQSTKVRQIVIDEAQDFNVVIYYCLRTLYPASSFTIVGDVMQNIYENGLHNWETVRRQVFIKNTEYAQLLKSYRNTIEISSFAKALMHHLGNSAFNVEPLIRHGEPVKIHPYLDFKHKAQMAETILHSMENNRLNAIVCRDEETATRVSKALQKSANVQLLNVRDKLSQGNYCVSVRNAKGLEFDSVLVFDFDEYLLSDTSLDHKQLYVAVTRALHELHIFSNDARMQALAKDSQLQA